MYMINDKRGEQKLIMMALMTILSGFFMMLDKFNWDDTE